MKRASLLLALAGLSFLAACGSAPTAGLTYGDAENPGRVTGVTGLESQDVANVVNYGAYTQAKTMAPQKKVCSFTAVKGMTMSFSGVESIECFAPETDTVAKPTEAKSKFERNTAAIGGLIRETKDVALGVLLYKDRKGARESNERLTESNNALELATQQSQNEFNRDALDAAAVRNEVFLVPAGTTPVAPTSVAPTSP